MGDNALSFCIDGSFNVAIGDHVLEGNAHGSANVAIGSTAGFKCHWVREHSNWCGLSRCFLPFQTYAVAASSTERERKNKL